MPPPLTILVHAQVQPIALIRPARTARCSNQSKRNPFPGYLTSANTAAALCCSKLAVDELPSVTAGDGPTVFYELLVFKSTAGV
jgi:hypothetical protein